MNTSINQNTIINIPGQKTTHTNQTYMHTRMHTRTHTHTHACANVHMHACMHNFTGSPHSQYFSTKASKTLTSSPGETSTNPHHHPKKQSFHHKLKYSNRAKNWLILIKAFNLLTRKWCSFIDKERAISCNQMSQIRIICMLNQARIIMHSAVNTVPHGGQIVNL